MSHHQISITFCQRGSPAKMLRLRFVILKKNIVCQLHLLFISFISFFTKIKNKNGKNGVGLHTSRERSQSVLMCAGVPPWPLEHSITARKNSFLPILQSLPAPLSLSSAPPLSTSASLSSVRMPRCGCQCLR